MHLLLIRKKFQSYCTFSTRVCLYLCVRVTISNFSICACFLFLGFYFCCPGANLWTSSSSSGPSPARPRSQKAAPTSRPAWAESSSSTSPARTRSGTSGLECSTIKIIYFKKKTKTINTGFPIINFCSGFDWYIQRAGSRRQKGLRRRRRRRRRAKFRRRRPPSRRGPKPALVDLILPLSFTRMSFSVFCLLFLSFFIINIFFFVFLFNLFLNDFLFILLCIIHFLRLLDCIFLTQQQPFCYHPTILLFKKKKNSSYLD
jgi:hypothetical protein